MFSWTAKPMTAQGPRKGEPSLRSMRYGLRPQPARLVRGSSRRIMSMRFRSANIRVINRRASSSAVIGFAVRTRNAQSPPTGTCSCYAARRRLFEMPERCSQRKGLLRRAKTRRALACSAPFRPATYATGGSDGNTSGSARSPGKRKSRLPSLRRKAGLTSGLNCQPHSGVDRSLHIRTWTYS
jgi:hypothetical protein